MILFSARSAESPGPEFGTPGGHGHSTCLLCACLQTPNQWLSCKISYRTKFPTQVCVNLTLKDPRWYVCVCVWVCIVWFFFSPRKEQGFFHTLLSETRWAELAQTSQKQFTSALRPDMECFNPKVYVCVCVCLRNHKWLGTGSEWNHGEPKYPSATDVQTWWVLMFACVLKQNTTKVNCRSSHYFTWNSDRAVLPLLSHVLYIVHQLLTFTL